MDALNNPASTGHNLDTAGVLHSDQHANANDAIEALEAKVGVDGSTVATTLDYLIKKGAAWTAYTPTLTQSVAVTKTVDYARWTRIGRTITAQVHLTVTGAGVGGNAVVIGLPVASATAVLITLGVGNIFDSSAGGVYKGVVVPASTTTAQMRPANTTTAGVLGADTFTAALAAGDEIDFLVTYEAAS